MNRECTIDQHIRDLEVMLAAARAVKKAWPNAVRATIHAAGERTISVFAVPDMQPENGRLYPHGEKLYVYEVLPYDNSSVPVFAESGPYGELPALQTLVLNNLQKRHPQAYAALVAEALRTQTT